MNTSIDTLKLKEILGSIQVKIDKIDDQIESSSHLKSEVEEIKTSFNNAYKILDFISTSDESEDKYPKGGKSL